MLRSLPFPVTQCAPDPLRLPNPTIGSDTAGKIGWIGAMSGSAWPGSRTGPDSTRLSVHGMAPTVGVPASPCVGWWDWSLSSRYIDGRTRRWSPIGWRIPTGRPVAARSISRTVRRSTPAAGCGFASGSGRLGERHGEAAGVAAGNRGHDGAGRGSDLSDRRQVAEPFPRTTGEVVSAAWGDCGSAPLARARRRGCGEPGCPCAAAAPQEPSDPTPADIPGPGGPGYGAKDRRERRPGAGVLRTSWSWPGGYWHRRRRGGTNGIACRHRKSSVSVKARLTGGYEFGVKGSLATAHRSHFLLGGMARAGNPDDGPPRKPALDPIRCRTGRSTAEGFVDRGDRGMARARPPYTGPGSGGA